MLTVATSTTTIAAATTTTQLIATTTLIERAGINVQITNKPINGYTHFFHIKPTLADQSRLLSQPIRRRFLIDLFD